MFHHNDEKFYYLRKIIGVGSEWNKIAFFRLLIFTAFSILLMMIHECWAKRSLQQFILQFKQRLFVHLRTQHLCKSLFFDVFAEIYCKKDIIFNSNFTWVIFLLLYIQRGLYATRIAGMFINFNIILIILPVCRSFNKLIHKLLHRISPHLLALYLEKLKVIHQFFALTLIYLSCEYRTKQT